MRTGLSRNREEVHSQAHVDAHCGETVSVMHQKTQISLCVLASQVFQSERACHTYFILNDSPPALNLMSACSRRTTQTPVKDKRSRRDDRGCGKVGMNVRTVSQRNFAVSGKSDRMKNETMAQSMVNSHPRMNIHAQPGLP